MYTVKLIPLLLTVFETSKKVAVMLIALVGLHFLASGAREHSVTTYQEVVHHSASPVLGLMSMSFIIIYTYG